MFDSALRRLIDPPLNRAGRALAVRGVGADRVSLIGLGFVGALMVAQPTLAGISVYALLAIGNAIFCAARDLSGRRIAG